MRWIVLLGLALPIPAWGQTSCPPDWEAQAIGRYDGTIRDTTQSVRITTVFRIVDGHLIGSYTNHEARREMTGTLTFIAAQACRVQFRYHDAYGEGPAIFSFRPDRIIAAWGWPGDRMIDPVLSWDGSRPQRWQ